MHNFDNDDEINDLFTGDSDPEGPDLNEMDDDDSDQYAETIPCPHCRRQIYENAERCPRCHQYLSEETIPSQKPRWFILTAIICLISIILFWVFVYHL